ncbi:MAG: hypothetical protein M1816_001433 [Peltula sp. TS41687]|nr:MAG: hypothetical protein M1816_001433 [Peltula sp. TS41687]
MQSTTAQSSHPFGGSSIDSSSRRRSAFQQSTPRKHLGSGGRVGGGSRDSKEGGPKREIWTSLLDSVASGKRLPEKNIFVLGGTPESQREFLKDLSPSQDPSSAAASGGTRGKGYEQQRQQWRRTAHVAAAAAANNHFAALGYTYLDVLDADHEDILARLSVYLLSDPSPSFMHLLRPLLTAKTLSNTLMVILLDWAQPWDWLRQLRDWIGLVRSLLASLDHDCQDVMERAMKDWQRERRTGGSHAGAAGGSSTNTKLGILPDVSLPLGPGELDDMLGLPLCVVCQNADQTGTLEEEHGWREEEFDFVQQTIRTILLKYGSSLIYTSLTNPNSFLQTLIHSSLNIHSLIQRGEPVVKHNIIDRDRILIPPIWDSWGKIRILREGFDCEAVHRGWAIDLDDHATTSRKSSSNEENNDNNNNNSAVNKDAAPAPTTAGGGGGATSAYEQTIRSPHGTTAHDPSTNTAPPQPKLEIEPTSTQSFLASQQEIIERLKHEEEHQQQIRNMNDNMNDNTTHPHQHQHHHAGGAHGQPSKIITDQIGPVQFNMGGIQIDADDMLKRIRSRHGADSPTSPGPGPGPTTTPAVPPTAGSAANATASTATAVSSNTHHPQNMINTTGGVSGVSGSSTPADEHQHHLSANAAATAGGGAGGSGSGVGANAGFLNVNLTSGVNPSSPERKSENEALANFFAGLMRRGGAAAAGQAGGGGGGGAGVGEGV